MLYARVVTNVQNGNGCTCIKVCWWDNKKTNKLSRKAETCRYRRVSETKPTVKRPSGLILSFPLFFLSPAVWCWDHSWLQLALIVVQRHGPLQKYNKLHRPRVVSHHDSIHATHVQRNKHIWPCLLSARIPPHWSPFACLHVRRRNKASEKEKSTWAYGRTIPSGINITSQLRVCHCYMDTVCYNEDLLTALVEGFSLCCVYKIRGFNLLSEQRCIFREDRTLQWLGIGKW